MENQVRDLEQLEERDPQDRGRRIGMVLMATLGIVALTFAMGVVVGKAAEPAASTKDPLDQLDRVAAATAKPSAPAAAAAKGESTAVNAADLSFPKSLTEEEDRPEVIAALAAAAKEEETLDDKVPAATVLAATAVDAQTAAGAARTTHAAQPSTAADDEAGDEPAHPAALPAAVAAGSAGQKLLKAAKHDQLVAAALPEAAPKERAPHGEEGEFTLQIVSYDAPAPAQAFASSLRAKGHEAFVTSADVPDRGRYYRVRIGPFATRDRAAAYRHKFENDEHMNTIVVRRSKDESER